MMLGIRAMSSLYIPVGSMLIASALATPMPAADFNKCRDVVCDAVCDVNKSGFYRPQDCDECCSSRGSGSSGNTDPRSTEERLNAVEASLSELKVMTCILLGVVLLLLLAFVLLFLQRTNNPLLRLNRSFFCKKKDCNNKEKKAQANGTVGNLIIGRLANHQNDSPQLRRASEPRLSTLGDTSLEPQPRPFRVRQPSESTCPEEGNDITPQGYDNLALSTSTIDANTLHNTSNSSTDTLGPAISTNTLHTVLPSENHLSSNGHINTRI